MTFRATLACVFLAALPALAIADEESQELEDEIKAVELQRKTLVSMREIDYLLAAARDHARPTDLVEKLTGRAKIGYFLRQAHTLAKDLTRGLEPVPPWLQRYTRALGGIGKVRKFAAGAHALETMIVATMDAESSTSAEKLRQMGGLIKDVNALVKSNLLLKEYVFAIGTVVESIAESAVVIENATQRTNRTIDEVRQAIVGTEYKEPAYYEHPLDAAIAKVGEELRRLEIRLRGLAYEEVEAAEKHCAKRLETSTQEMNRLRHEAWQDMLAMRRLARAHRTVRIRASQLRWLLRRLRGDVAVLGASAKGSHTAEETVKSTDKLHRVRERLRVFESELAELQATAPEHLGALVKRFREIKGLYRHKRLRLRRFEDCVGEQLTDAEHADRAFLRDRFPHYVSRHRRRSISVRNPATLRVQRAPSPENAYWACLEAPHPRRTGRARSFRRSYRVSVGAGETHTQYVQVWRGTDISVRLEPVTGKAELHLFREVRAEEDLGQFDENYHRLADLRSALKKSGRAWIHLSHTESFLFLGPSRQGYQINAKGRRGGPATFVLHVDCRDRGDLGLRTDAGGKDAPLPVLPLGKEFVGYITGNDPRDDFVIPNVPAHTRIRITLGVKRIGRRDDVKAWERIRLERWSVVCDASGQRRSYRLGTFSTENTLVRHGQTSYFDFITDQPGHYRIGLKPEYSGYNQYRIKAETLHPIRVERDGKLVGLLGQQQHGWYFKVPGVYAVSSCFKTEAEARARLLQSR